MASKNGKTKTATVIPTRNHDTYSDIDQKTRKAMVDVLNQQLVDTVDLYSQLKQAHWNVKGMNFIAVHHLFDDVAEHVRLFADAIAERVTALGADAKGTVRISAEYSTLLEFPDNLKGTEAFLQAVAERVAHYNKNTRHAISLAEEADDMATNDLFVEVVREMDEQLYFIESHIQA